ncbi:MAG: dihydroneopterin aldolase [Bacillota bacterium]
MKTDIIFIEGLRVDATVGAHNWEQRVNRTLTIDLELAGDIARAAANDRLGDTIDYKSVAEAVAAICAQSRHKLIETMAEELARELTKRFALGWLRVTVRKPGAVANAESVGVRIERGSKD